MTGPSRPHLMVPTPGRIVQYTLTPYDAAAIERVRADARGALAYHRVNRYGVIAHAGNSVVAGATYPLLITRVWDEVPTPASEVNGQVMLDGNDTLWVTSVIQGDGEGRWREYPRI